MSIQFNPVNPDHSVSRAHRHSQPQGCGHRCHRSHQHRVHDASTLTVPNQSSSCLDKLKQWVTSIFSWIKNLFPQKSRAPVPNSISQPATGSNPISQPAIGSPTVSPPRSSTASNISRNNSRQDSKRFEKDDIDYQGQGYTQREIVHDLQHAENCCAYPKLAFYLSKHYGMSLQRACVRINIASQKDPQATSMTPQFVLQNSPT
jgi:hypothetical protein